MIHFQVISNERRRTVNHGLETKCYGAAFLWTNLPPEYKHANILNIFKRKIENWIWENCPCRLCKTYIRELGYIKFPPSLSIAVTFFFFFFFNTIKKTVPRSTFHRKKKNIHCNLTYITIRRCYLVSIVKIIKTM